jgi:hypothetical protein
VLPTAETGKPRSPAGAGERGRRTSGRAPVTIGPRRGWNGRAGQGVVQTTYAVMLCVVVPVFLPKTSQPEPAGRVSRR